MFQTLELEIPKKKQIFLLLLEAYVYLKYEEIRISQSQFDIL